MKIGDEILLRAKVVGFDGNPYGVAIKVEINGFLDPNERDAHDGPLKVWIHRLDQQKIIISKGDGITVKEIIENYLRTNGFNGLYKSDEGCACELNDLCLCGFYESPVDCKPGYKRLCETCKEEDCDMRGETTSCIGEEKQQ